MTEELENLFRYMTDHFDGLEAVIIRCGDGAEWHVTWENYRCNITQTVRYTL